MKKSPLMKCGHRANSTDENDNPICGLCSRNHEGYNKRATRKWDGRKARCPFCNIIKDSSADLPLFCYKPDEEYDSYYCGCKD
ncbi:hypothetical protein [Clostridium omnivorum]|uniref:Uncharacterized protein n=1 Tax=Clostridium omnivorum TaxID=1604902 RepID=A0ABQ5N0W6_9CLOT|nr:hypothetical protein [Clostridium sp. E14]GLC28821.1 hypothetical protein bsdE14_02310 [Clostridium sp. E14]